MRPMNMKTVISKRQLLLTMMAAVTLLLTPTAFGAVPGINGTSTPGTFALTAQDGYLNQPDGSSVYSWGYGCATAPPAASFLPQPGGNNLAGANCPTMQIPGPSMIVTEGQTVTVTLTNNLPAAAGNTSILFPGFQVSATGGTAGLMTQEAPPGGSVTYTFVASAPGTHAYYSGTQGDLQIEMGLYGAVVVIPAPANVPANCTTGYQAQNLAAEAHWGEKDFRLSQAAYDHPGTCYDREYLFQWSEMDGRIHRQAQAEVADPIRAAACAAPANASGVRPGCSLDVQTEPYHPSFFLINGRSMPDLMDPNYAGEYPHQPYNGNPHMHPGELTLIRTIGQGRWQHPFHEHANHVRILARDGNLILSSNAAQVSYSTPGGTAVSGPGLAGVLMFNTDTTPGEAFDGIFYFTGRGLNWDPYGHHPVSSSADPLATLTCTPDANGLNSGAPTAVNFFEWCQDHNKPVQVAPFGDVASGGPVTLPDPDIFTNGAWYGGTPYLGPDASLRAGAPACSTTQNAGCTPLQPSNDQANPANERGWAFMWHSHNEREITTNNIFPGGMLMMMLVDSREFVIDEGL